MYLTTAVGSGESQPNGLVYLGEELEAKELDSTPKDQGQHSRDADNSEELFLPIGHVACMWLVFVARYFSIDA